MKKILTILFCIIFYTGFSQTLTPPNTPGFTSRSTLPVEDKIMSVRQHFNLPRYTDTSQANSYGLIDSCGAMIFTYDVMAVWFRSCYNGGRKWIQILPAGGGTGGLNAWTTTLNTAIPTDISLNGYFGTTASNGIGFYTSNTQRLILPASGLTFNQLVTDTTANKVMTFNPSTKAWGYGYWYGGSGSTPTWQQTLTAGSTLNTDNTVDGGGNDFLFYNNSTLQFGATGNGSYVNLAQSSNGGFTTSNVLLNDSITISTSTGKYYLSSIPYSSNIGDSMLVWRASTGLVGMRAIPSSATHTWQQTLTAGSTLNTDNTINGGGYIFTFDNVGEFYVNTAADISLSNTLGSTLNQLELGGSVLLSSSLIGNRGSSMSILTDSIKLRPGLGNLIIDTLTNVAARYVLHYNPITGLVSYADTTASTGFANTALSNLASVAVNTSILPGTTNTIALGSTAKIWSDVQTSYFHTGGLNGTYAGYSGGQLGGTATHAVLDFVDNNSRIGEFYTDANSFNFFSDVSKSINFYVNSNFSYPTIGLATTGRVRTGAYGTGALTGTPAYLPMWDASGVFIESPLGYYIKTAGTSQLTAAAEVDMNGFDFTINNTAANDEVFLVAVNPGLVEFKLVADTKKAYLLSGAIAAGADGDALTIVDHTTGELGSAPNLAFQLHKQNTDIGATDGKVWVSDSVGNKTIISPHYFPSDIKPSEDMAWSFYSRNEKIGKEIFIDMLLLARKVEQLTGEKLVYIKDIKK